MEYPPQSQDNLTYIQGYGIEPSTDALNAGLKYDTDVSTIAGIAEASLTPDDMGPMTVHKPVQWEDFRGNNVTMANQKNTIRMTGEFSEAELAVVALKRDAYAAEAAAHAQQMAQQAMNASNSDITRNTLLGKDDEEDEKNPALAKIA